MLGALWGYDGWNQMPMVAGEVRRPERNVPLALVAGMVAIILIYGLANLAYFYALPFQEVVTSNSTLYRDSLPVASRAAGASASRAEPFSGPWVLRWWPFWSRSSPGWSCSPVATTRVTSMCFTGS